MIKLWNLNKIFKKMLKINKIWNKLSSQMSNKLFNQISNKLFNQMSSLMIMHNYIQFKMKLS